MFLDFNWWSGQNLLSMIICSERPHCSSFLTMSNHQKKAEIPWDLLDHPVPLPWWHAPPNGSDAGAEEYLAMWCSCKWKRKKDQVGVILKNIPKPVRHPFFPRKKGKELSVYVILNIPCGIWISKRTMTLESYHWACLSSYSSMIYLSYSRVQLEEH